MQEIKKTFNEMKENRKKLKKIIKLNKYIIKLKKLNKKYEIEMFRKENNYLIIKFEV